MTDYTEGDASEIRRFYGQKVVVAWVFKLKSSRVAS